MEELLNKSANKILPLGYTQKTIEAELKSLTKQIQELEEKMTATRYVGQVIKRGYGVGDMVTNGKDKLKVVSYNAGFWASDPKVAKSKAKMLYDGWKRI